MPYLAGCITFDKHSHVVIAILSRKILLVRLNKFFVGMFLCTICTIALIFTEKKTLVRMNKVGNVHYLREKIISPFEQIFCWKCSFARTQLH